MSNKKYVRTWSIVIAVVLVLAIGLNIAASAFDSFLDHYLGGNPYDIITVEGSENWDTNYYTQTYATKEEATAAAEKLLIEVASEGIVLLKNDNSALPLSTSTTVSLLGRYAADPVYGGSGSGTVDASTCYDFYKGISEAGFTINDTAYNWIKDNYSKYAKCSIAMDNPSGSSYYIGEIPWADYSSEAQSSISGTTAVIVIGRGGGEGGNLSSNLLGDLNSGVSSAFTANDETANYEEGQHQLELTVEEKSLIAAAKASCEKVVVLLNVSTTMEVGPLMDGEYEVDAILQVGSIGATGAVAVGRVLSGAVNPSGRTVDLWAADFTKDPTYVNCENGQYTDVTGYYTASGGTAYFIEYEEGIYIGYRYYETAHVEAENGNYAGFNYDEAVVYPFGYGLSYTTFEKTLDSVKVDGDNVVVTVTVKNTGSVAGKEVVQAYYTAPYTPGGIEKSAVVLGDFTKTQMLEPGASETVTLTWEVRDMSSWDSSKGAYVLDAGDYVISLRNNSHDVIATETVSLNGETYTTDNKTGNELSNLFSDITEYMNANCTNLSRSDFAGTWPTGSMEKNAADLGLTFEQFDASTMVNADDVMPTLGADNGLQLIDVRGLDYDDPQWDLLLDELTVEDMISVLVDGAYNTAAIDSIGKPTTSDPDGPQGFTSLMGGTGNCSYCSEYLMAQTWNTELMYKLGEMIGEEALTSGYSGWYAPAMNTHRSPFAGRNFEYYSEDGTLGGKIGAAVVSGAASKGVYSFIKHYALNDTEENRVTHICTWATEQTIREIYLKPFELTVKDATCELKYISDENGTVSTKTINGCTAVMSSFNYLGSTWAGGHWGLMTGILRNEWGFEGMVISDFNLYDYMDVNQGWYAGTDHNITYRMFKTLQDTESATAVLSIRQSIHRLLYTVANSNAMQGVAPGSVFVYHLATWQIILYSVTAVMLGFCVIAAVCVITRVRIYKKKEN